MKTIFITLFLIAPSSVLLAQTEGMLLPLIVVGNDTFPTCTLQEVVVVSKRVFKDQAEMYRFNQLKRNIFIVYPYAKEAGTLFKQVNIDMAAMEKNKDRKKYVRDKEKELDQLYENSLKNMTVTQGGLLVKLIARETGMSVYDLLKEFKNPMSAFYWNKVSGLYGYSLKENYDPQQERDIEMIVRSIEGDF